MKQFLSILVTFVLAGVLSAQCPDKNFLWHRIIYLRDSSKVPFVDQKNELLGYLEQADRCSYKIDSVHALLLQRVGWLFSLEKDYAKAVMYTKASLDLIYNNLNKPNVNYAHVIKTYFNLRILYDSCGQHRLALKATDSCIAIGLRLHKGYEYALTLLPTRTYSYLENGDYYKCIEYASLGETMCKTEPAYSSYLNYYVIWKLNSLVLLKKLDEAKQLLQSTLPSYLKSGDKHFLGTFYALMANMSEENGDERQALFYINKCSIYNKKSGDLNVIAQAWSNMGYELYFKKSRNYVAALACYKKAIPYATSEDLVNIYYNIAAVWAMQRQYDSAFYYFQRAFDQIKAGIDEKDLLVHTQEYVGSKIIEYIINLVLDKAELYFTRFKEKNDRQSLGRAIEIYKTADQLFENIKKSQYDIESKLFWRQNLHRLYDRSIEACFLQNNAANAFYFFERSRAVLLNDQLSEHKWSASGDILQQSLLKRQILEEERELSKLDERSPRHNELQSLLFSHRQQIDVLQDVIKSKIPFYYQNFLDSSFISIQDVRRDILRDHDALIELFSGDSAVYLLTIDKAKTYFKKIEKDNFDSLSSSFEAYLSKPERINQDYNSFATISHGLYELIFRGTSVPRGRIIISPDKNYLPFEALVTNTNPLSYFLDDHAVSYTYSARFLGQFSTSTSSRKHIFMGIAPVKYSGLPGLAGSDQSLKDVEQNFGHSTSYIGNNATRNNFLTEFYKYKIVQLYTHATDNGQGGEPMIYFADSTLGLSDLLPQEKPVSDLIVLSACQTASGKVYSGEGVFSFNRSFAALGIPSTVSNLWQTNDQATYRLTELFYKYVAKGMPLDLALQKAKLELLHADGSDEYRLPYFWASTILVGKTDAITFGKRFNWEWLVFSLLATLLLVGGWTIRTRKTASTSGENSKSPEVGTLNH